MKEIPAHINIQEYNYPLPEERIAKYPLETRDNSKLLFFNQGNIETRIFSELPEIVSDQHHLIFNDTKVIQARLLFHKTSGPAIEIFLLEPFLPPEYALSFSSNRECTWKCLIGNAKKWKTGILQKELNIDGTHIILKAEKAGREGNYFFVRFNWDNESIILSEIIEHAGSTPIPPYLYRDAELSDCIRYQTVYSANEGSVAAPTAGLHFTKNIIKELENNGVAQTSLTLHVSAGTFIPVKVENALDHKMHNEHIYLDRKSIERLCLSEKMFIAVGTTSVRTLESLYHVGVKIKNGLCLENNLFLDQWEAYQTKSFISRMESLEYILSYMDSFKLDKLHISTKIMIVPGYEFRMIDGIITNFHQPKSTLLLLIAAFTGEKWKEIYDFALNNNFRFLSYGDSSFLLKETEIESGMNDCQPKIHNS